MVAGDYESSLLSAIAQWIAVVGVPAAFVWNWKLVQWLHRHDVQLSDQANIRGKLDSIERGMQELRGIVIELRTLQEVADGNRRRRSTDDRG